MLSCSPLLSYCFWCSLPHGILAETERRAVKKIEIGTENAVIEMIGGIGKEIEVIEGIEGIEVIETGSGIEAMIAKG
jgi:hypothetical protein